MTGYGGGVTFKEFKRLFDSSNCKYSNFPKMKKLAFFNTILLMFLSSCVINGWDQVISGNGHVVTKSREISGFTGIHISSGIDVWLSQGSEFEVTVEADENLHDVIVTEINGDLLVVKTDHVNIQNAKSKIVHITLPELTELKISSAGDCVGQTPFNCNDLRISISSAGDLTLEVEAGKIDLDISSSGDATLSGSANVFNVGLSSAGDLNAFDLIAAKVDVDVSSAGDARVHATEELTMNASSAGNIYYRGDAKIQHSRTSSAGDIIRRD
jgi:adhesin HecA-like repeat protein